MNPSLSVVIGTRNRLEILKTSLHAIVGKIKTHHEIIIVDAGSADGTIEYLNRLDEVKLICDGKPIGQAQSLNRIFRTLNTKYVCWLSDDNVFQPGVRCNRTIY
jgi:glycosyltransferase involved in cell wall biosynthesis